MKVTSSNKHKLFIPTCIIFVSCGLLTILFMALNLHYSLITVTLIFCVTSLVIFLAYGGYLLCRKFYLNREQRTEETTPLLEGQENLELGLPTDFESVTTEGSGRKQSSPRPMPKIRMTHLHPTPMPRQSYLTDVFMSNFKAFGDFIRSRRHTVSESNLIDLDNVSVDYIRSERTHTKSESEMSNQSMRFSPHEVRWKHSLPNQEEELFEIDLNCAEQHHKGLKNN